MQITKVYMTLQSEFFSKFEGLFISPKMYSQWYYPGFDSIEICTLVNFKMNTSTLGKY